MIADRDHPVLVISPHLDDAVLSAWSVLRSPPSAGVRVVVLFAGVPPDGTTGRYDPIFGAHDSAALVRQRRAEDVAALGAAGITPIHLDHLDDQYRTDGVDIDELAAAVEAVVDGAAEIVAPAGIGRHADHVAAREVAFELARRSGAPVSIYADLPYATSLGWPAWVTGGTADPHLAPEAAWARVLAEVADPADLEPVVTRFGDDECAAKLASARCYASQWSALEGGPHARISHPAVAPFEVRWRVLRRPA